MTTVVAVDAGSSRVRVSVISLADGSVVAGGSVPTRSSGGELDAEALWRDVAGLLRELGPAAATAVGLGVAAQLGTVLVDGGDRPLRPALLWGDARAGAEARALAARLDTDRVGRPLTGELPIAKLRWLAAHETLDGLDGLLSLKDFLVLRLTGQRVTDEAHASYSGLFDVRGRHWSLDAVTAARIDPRVLPAPLPGAAVAGDLVAGLGLPAGLPVAVGGPDGTVGAVGAGAVVPGVTVDVAGTTDVLLHTVDSLAAVGRPPAPAAPGPASPDDAASGNIRGAVSPGTASPEGAAGETRVVASPAAPAGAHGPTSLGPASPPAPGEARRVASPAAPGRSGAVVNAHVVPGLWTVGGPTGLTGGAVEWTARLLGFESVAAAHAALEPLPDDLAALPEFAPGLGGTRFPSWRADATGTLGALRPEHGPADVLCAAHVGAARTIEEGLRALAALGLRVERVVMVGGAARRPGTVRLRERVWGLPITTLANHEATSVGAAMLAAVAAGAHPDLPAAAAALVRPRTVQEIT